MPSIFTRIVHGEIPSHRVWEDDNHYAFLDINPVTRGHTLVVPKHEVDYIFDMEPEAYAELWKAARTVAAALKTATGCNRVITIVEGYEVPHAHIHLIPTNQVRDWRQPAGTLDPAEVDELLASIRAAF
ncbi:MAG: HIT family protein [Planctomycetota bacterium]|nr:HIT family protein [Planctomycetota bacterium]